MRAGQATQLAAETSVYQCSECRTVLSDSTVLVGVSDELGMICFSAVTDEAAVQTKELVEKGKGPLKSSAYVAIQCACCEQIVGRVYSTAPKKYSEICDKFCFHTNNLRTYSLGAFTRRAVEEKTEDGQWAGAGPGPQSALPSGRLDGVEARLARCEDDLLQVQHQIFLHAQEFLAMGRTMGIDQDQLVMELEDVGAG